MTNHNVWMLAAAAAAAAIGSVTAGTTPLPSKELLRRSSGGMPPKEQSNALKRSLLKNAIPFDSSKLSAAQQQQERRINTEARRLDDGEFEITSQYTIQYNTCISLKTGSSNNNNNNNNNNNANDLLFNSDLYNYTKAGTIVNEKSYVLFNICLTDTDCTTNGGNNNLYMIDINSYMTTLSEFYINEQAKYCIACSYNMNYCSYVAEQEAKAASYYKSNGKYEQASMAENQYAGTSYNDGSSSYYNYNHNYANQGGNNGGNRHLASSAVDMSMYKILNCTKCDDLLCDEYYAYVLNQQNEENGNNNNNNNNVDDANAAIVMGDVVEWVQAMAECQLTSATLLDQGTYPLYSGFMCNDDGTGIEIALFLDEDCMTYTSLQSYKKIASETYDLPYLEYAKNILKYPIENDISCNMNYNYINKELYSNFQYQQQYGGYNNNYNNNNDNNNNNNENYEASEYCRDLFEGGEEGEAMSLNNCPVADNNGDDDSYAAQYDEDGNEVVPTYEDSTYSWYTYVLQQSDEREAEQAVCHVVQLMNGQYSHIYQSSGSGSLYKDITSTSTNTNKYHYTVDSINSYAKMASDKLTPKVIFFIVIGVLSAIGACGCILYSCCCMKSIPNQYTEQTEGIMRVKRSKREIIDDGKRERLVDATTGQLA